jgi:hypothetical protein
VIFGKKGRTFERTPENGEIKGRTKGRTKTRNIEIMNNYAYGFACINGKKK